MSLVPINLSKGHPNTQLLPVRQIQKAAVAALSESETSHSGLSYGPDPGYQPLRENVASWLTNFYSPSSITADRVCITGGASQNLACILQVFSDPIYTKNAWLVSPTYFHASRIFEDSGFHGRLRSVPEDDQGLNIEYLSAALEDSERETKKNGNDMPQFKPPRPYSKIYRYIIYAVPTFSNPSSMAVTLFRRQQLVRLARQYDALVITDDVYDQLQWPADTSRTASVLNHAALPRLVDIDCTLDGGAERDGSDGFGNTVSNGSFSKIAGPGCRTGWAEGTAKFAWGLSQCGSSKSGGAPSQLVATFMSKMLESGDLQHHILETLQPAYARRYRTMMKAIDGHLVPLGVTLPQREREVMGGYFVWLLLPPDIRAPDVALRAKEDELLDVAPGSAASVWGDEAAVNLDGNIRLCFVYEEEEKLAEGVERLARVIERMQEKGCRH